ncbi:uncharacterized protein LAESUDRAFT_647985 [Laetiporus sulphureus 93-53]|uniref:Uncharacterized protein n=1 Tax=Laetiporus sulphureus 93-53 TaxID=1314785 RepID=A0A165FF51_9APHY|nr:uncharacterized protein LAESUDRAFT_647985 [Laetiporus sulphureus 93-53]KZT08875.1 hypothetical protein LAESUDRAFT_647985 [Laetiporus sulphureus 93-53]
MLDNMPHLCLSSDHLRFILFIFHELGVHGVPSLKAFRKKQDEIVKICGINTDAKRTSFSHVFYQN